MSNKVITVWLILLTAWVGFSALSENRNRQIRESNTLIRIQKFEDIIARLESQEQFINGPLRDELNEIKKYLHEH